MRISRDGGGGADVVGALGGRPEALTVDGRGRLYAVTVEGELRESGDGGRSWETTLRPRRR